MSDADFRRWAKLVEERLDMDLPDTRKVFLRTALWGRMRDQDETDFLHYFELVTASPGGAAEWRALVDALTVQETRFYRHGPSYELVRRYLLGLARAGAGPVELWSVGCSTGEEPWTLAMVADDVLSGVPLHYGVLGSDVSAAALRTARTGEYTARRADALPANLRERYLDPLGTDQVRVAEVLRPRVAFSLQNLKDVERAPQRAQNVIYCQNVLIYFRRQRRREILDALAERLAPGGLLVMAAGESVDWRPQQLQRVPGDDVVAWTRSQQGDTPNG